MGVPEMAVEKDFHLTRLIWALAETFGQRLLLKGGTCLSKVDLGYHRMSEDADFVLPWNGSLTHKGTNAYHTNKVRDALREVAPQLGMRFVNVDGWPFDRRSHLIWDVEYDGRFPPTALTVEVVMRPVHRPPRRAALRTLLAGPLARGYDQAYCWALDADEVRAAKVRAALTRRPPEIRDFFDLQLLLDAGADFVSREFVALVDRKLIEVGHPALAQCAPSFALSADQRAHLSGPGLKRLESVLPVDATPFNLDALLRRFDNLWGKHRRD